MWTSNSVYYYLLPPTTTATSKPSLVTNGYKVVAQVASAALDAGPLVETAPVAKGVVDGRCPPFAGLHGVAALGNVVPPFRPRSVVDEPWMDGVWMRWIYGVMRIVFVDL